MSAKHEKISGKRVAEILTKHASTLLTVLMSATLRVQKR